jgi:hypothetical protein
MRLDKIDDVYRGLGVMREQGGTLVEIRRPQPTLEEQFLKAVDEDMRRGDNRAGAKKAKRK